MKYQLDFTYLFELIPEILKFVPVTILMTIFAMILAVLGGLILAMLLRKNIPVVTQLIVIYISFFRSIPTLVLLFLAYYGIPQILPFLETVGAMTMAIVSLAFKQSAFLAEVFRAARTSVDDGQEEACLSVGMTKYQAFRRVILPQATRNAIPATGNVFIIITKETSLAFTIGITELFARGKILAAESLNFFETYLVVALVYWLIIIIY